MIWYVLGAQKENSMWEMLTTSFNFCFLAWSVYYFLGNERAHEQFFSNFGMDPLAFPFVDLLRASSHLRVRIYYYVILALFLVFLSCTFSWV